MWKGPFAFEIALGGYCLYLAVKAMTARNASLPSVPLRLVMAFLFEVTRANIIIAAMTAANDYESDPIPSLVFIIGAGAIAGYFSGFLVGGLEARPKDSEWKLMTALAVSVLYYLLVFDAEFVGPTLKALNPIEGGDWLVFSHCTSVLLLALAGIVNESGAKPHIPKPSPKPATKKGSTVEAEAHKEQLRLPLLKLAFGAIDKDKSNGINMEELAAFGQYIGNRDWDSKKLALVFEAMDTNKDGQVDLGEFQDFCFKETAHHSTETFQAMIRSFVEVGNMLDENRKLIKAVYDKIDLDGNGFVNRAEMKEFGLFMNSKFDDAKLNKLMTQMDLDRDGVVSCEEFIGYFAKLSKPVDDASFCKGMQRYLKFEKGKAGRASPGGKNDVDLTRTLSQANVTG